MVNYILKPKADHVSGSDTCLLIFRQSKESDLSGLLYRYKNQKI